MDDDTTSPLFMRESMENGGKSMLARHIRVAPSVTVVAFLSPSKTNIRPNGKLNVCMPIKYQTKEKSAYHHDI